MSNDREGNLLPVVTCNIPCHYFSIGQMYCSTIKSFILSFTIKSMCPVKIQYLAFIIFLMCRILIRWYKN